MTPSDFFRVFLSSWGWMKWLLRIFLPHQRAFVAWNIFYNQYGSASAETVCVEKEVMFIFALMQMNWRHNCLHPGDMHVSACLAACSAPSFSLCHFCRDCGT